MEDLHKTWQEKRRFANITHVTSVQTYIVYFTYKGKGKNTGVLAHAVKVYSSR
jgi:hypothetical protein